MVVDGFHPGHLLRSKRRELGGTDIGEDLGLLACPGDDGGDGFVHENPAKGVGNQILGAEELFQGFHSLKPQGIVYPGEGFALVEGLAVAVIAPVVVLAEHRVLGVFSCEQAAGQGYPGQDADVLFLSLREQFLGGFQAEHIENHFHSGNGVFHGGKALGYLLNAYAIVGDFALLHQLIHPGKEAVLVVDGGGGTVEKHQVQLLHPQPPEAAVNEGLHVLRGVAFCGVGVQAPAALGHHKKVVRVGFQELSDGLFAVAVVVNIRRVNEMDAAVIASLQNLHGLSFIEGVSPTGTQLPGTQADIADHPVGFSEFS